ncbi:hypothetical protein TNCV_2682621 [Trichonephila clavipes]|nr:hypothetical protein TNCV_2682621 [Trichonephila clavipes]
MGKATDLSPFEKELILGAHLAGNKISLGPQKQPYRRFSKVEIRIHGPSLEDVTVVRAQFSKNVIHVRRIVRQNNESTVLQLAQTVTQGSTQQISTRNKHGCQ